MSIQDLDFSQVPAQSNTSVVDIDFADVQGPGGGFTPLDNTASFDPDYMSHSGTEITLSNANKTAEGVIGVNYGLVRLDMPLKGKVQWEVSYVFAGSNIGFGITKSTNDFRAETGTVYVGLHQDSWGMFIRGWTPDIKYNNGSSLGNLTSSIDDTDRTIAFRFDDITSLLEYSDDGITWHEFSSGITGRLFFAVSIQDIGATVTLNTGQSEPTLPVDEAGGYSFGLADVDFYSELIIEDSATSHWKVDELSGTLAIDAIGGRDGTYTAGYTLAQPPISPAGKSIELDATGYIDLGTSLSDIVGLKDFTVVAWVNPTVTSTWQQVFCADNTTTAVPSISLYTRTDTNKSRITITDSGDSSYSLDSLLELQVGVSYMLAGSYDSHAGILKIYINGSLENTVFIGKDLSIKTLDGNTVIGAGYSNHILTDQFNGAIDNVYFADRDLSEYEIYKHYLAGTTYLDPGLGDYTYTDIILQDSPVLYYEFDETDGLVEDRSGNGNHGTVTGSWELHGDGIVSDALHSADGTVKGIDPVSGNYDSMTCLEFWFKDINDQDSNGYIAITDKWVSSTDRWMILLEPGYNFPTLKYNFDTRALQADTDHMNSSEWNHCVIQFESTSSLSKMYINSVEQATTFSGNVFATGAGGGLRIGGYRHLTDVTTAGSLFSGSLDAYAIYNTELTYGEIQERYFLGALEYHPSQRYHENVIAKSPTAYYRLNEQLQRITASDSSGNAYNGTYFKSDISVELFIKSGAYFDGVQDYITLPTSIIASGASTRTIELWFSKDVMATGNETLVLLGNHSDGEAILMAVDAVGLRFDGWGVAFEDHYTLDYTTGPVHMVLTYDGTTKRCYVNGSKVIERSQVLNTGSTYAVIGQRGDDAEYFYSLIDDVSIYPQVLNDTEIIDNYNKGLTEINDIISWDYERNTEDVTFSQLDLSVIKNTLVAYATVFCEVGVWNDIHYWETTVSFNQGAGVGIATVSHLQTDFVGFGTESYGLWASGIWHGSSNVDNSISLLTGTVGHKLDMQAGTYEVTVDGSVYHTVVTGLAGQWFPVVTVNYLDTLCVGNFIGPFIYSVPVDATAYHRDLPRDFHPHHLFDNTYLAAVIDRSTPYEYKLTKTSKGSQVGSNLVSNNSALGENFVIAFGREHDLAWFDDDHDIEYPKSTLGLAVVFAIDSGDLTFYTNGSRYYQPGYALAGKFLQLRFRGTLGDPMRLIDNSDSIGVDMSVISSFVADDLSGINLITAHFYYNGSTNQYDIEVRAGGLLRQTGSTTTTYTANDIDDGIFVFHFNDYNDNASSETITSLKLIEGTLDFNNAIERNDIYAYAIESLSPIGYWRLDEPDGSTAFDSSGNENDGAYNSATLAQPSLVSEGYAVSLNGSSDVEIDSSLYALTGDMTATFLISYPAIVGNKVILSWSGTGETEDTNSTFLIMNGTSQPDEFLYFHESGAGVNTYVQSSGANIQVGTTYQVVVTRSISTKEIRFYVNGSKITTGTYIDNPTGGSTGTLRIGSQDGGKYVTATIDEVAIYDRAVSDAEARQIYAAYNPETYHDKVFYYGPPVLWYKLNESSGTTIQDSSPGGNDGVIEGNYLLQQISYLTTYSVWMDDDASIRRASIATAAPFSVEAWVKTTDSGNKIIFEDSGDSGWSLQLYGGDVQFNVGGTVIGANVTRTSGESIDDDIWHQIVVVYYGSGITTEIHVDGIESSYAQRNSTLPTYGGEIAVGERSSSSNTGMVGMYDEVIIWDKVLSSIEIQDLYTSYTPPVQNTYTFTLPYNLGRIDTVTHAFTLNFTNAIPLGLEFNFIIPYLLDFEQVAVQNDFTLPYLSTPGATEEFGYPLQLIYGTSTTGFSVYEFRSRYNIEKTEVSTHNFRIKYSLDFEDSLYDFRFKYKLNKEQVGRSFLFNLRSKLGFIGPKEHKFRSRYRIGRISGSTNETVFIIKHKVEKARQITNEYTIPFSLEKAMVNDNVFNFESFLRLIENNIQTISGFNTDIDGTHYTTELDLDTLPTGNYNIVIDNGNRYSKYIIDTNTGLNISGPVDVTYDYTLDIPLFAPINTELDYSSEDVKYYNGTHGWKQMTSSIEFGEGAQLLGSAFLSLPGPKPYSALRQEQALSITNEGYYVFDYELSIENGLFRPVLFLIDQVSNRVIHIGKQEEQVNRTRLVAYLPAGLYTLVPATQIQGDIVNGLYDASFSLTGFGQDYGDTDLFITELGYQEQNEIPESGVTFEVRTITIDVKNITKESSLSLSFLDHDLGLIGQKWTSLIPDQELETENYEPEVVELSSPLLRLKMKLPDTCCFGTKLSLDEFETLCRVPTPKFVDRENYSINSTITLSHTFDTPFFLDLLSGELCSNSESTIMIYDTSDETINISRDLGNTFTYIGSKLSAFEHDGWIDDDQEIRIEGKGGKYIITTVLTDEEPA